MADFPSGLKILKTEIGDASHNLQEQTADLGQLKAKYLALTGLSYEQSGRRKGALSRLRAFGGGGGGNVINGGNSNHGSSSGNRNITNNNTGNNNNNNINNNNNSGNNRPTVQTHGGSGGMNNSTGLGLGGSPRRSTNMGGFPRGGKLPSHWLPTRMERLDHHISHNTEADVVVNLVVVSMFAFCLICTIFLANLISLIK